MKNSNKKETTSADIEHLLSYLSEEERRRNRERNLKRRKEMGYDKLEEKLIKAGAMRPDSLLE